MPFGTFEKSYDIFFLFKKTGNSEEFIYCFEKKVNMKIIIGSITT